MTTVKQFIESEGGKDKFYSLLNDLMAEFDFAKVADVMDALDWGWAVRGTFETEVPDESTIRKTVFKEFVHMTSADFLDSYPNDDRLVMSTGGFEYVIMAYWDEDLNRDTIELQLKFVIEEYAAYDVEPSSCA